MVEEISRKGHNYMLQHYAFIMKIIVLLKLDGFIEATLILFG